MSKLWQIFFWGMILMSVITGSLSLSKTELFNQKILLTLPIILALLIFNSATKPQINKTLLKLLFGLVLTILAAFLFSQHYANSANYLCRWLSGLSLFVFALWFGNDLRPKLPKILLFLGVLYGLLYLLLNYLPQRFAWLMPQNGYNLIFPTYRLHNHLGDFLVLPLLAVIYQLKNHKKPFLALGWIIIFGLLVFHSYSRSSYTALAAGLIIFFIIQIKDKAKFSQLLIGLILIFAAGLFLLLTTQETSLNLKFLNAIEGKLLLNGRDQYWGTSLQTIRDYFWFGIGGGNFIYAMGRYSSIPFNWTASSLNIFLSLFSENGVFVFVIFVALIIWVMKNSYFDLNFVLLIALLVNFQTDYTYEIIGMWLLLWFILGLNVRHQPPYRPIQPNWLILPGLIGILLLLQLVITPVLGLLKFYNLAWFINPLDKNNQEKLIVKQLFNQQYSLALWQLRLYQKLYRADSYSQYAAANYYLVLNQPQLALKAFYQAYQWNPYTNLDLYRRIYGLEKKLNGQKAARLFLRDYEAKVKKIKDKSYFSQKIKKDWQEFSQAQK